eukprot:CAMPEP_0194124828 /NCGR_PEP_ID=MMETSP0150-20130528/59146_1 /TAXON_ID=122233 /ORGANISM="Chaetoceros debilis, Strain MM31A-1" /LENGTH=289 /DNA_ID=CAMNT_0038818611 /DNA_START=106 /DNA_END=975 /DNA_ORIENTATION=+
MFGRSLLFAFFTFTSELTPTTASQQSSGSPDSDSELGNHNQFSNIRRVNTGDVCVYDSDSKNSCPIAMCLPAPEGCNYIDKYVVSEDGECCPSMCYAVDSDGNECFENEIDITDPSNEGDICAADDEQKNALGCPVAKCMAPPEGCSYMFDHYVTNSEGDCCASLCYAVDSDGAKCAVINIENEIDITDPSIEGDICTADDEEKNALGCPVATCMAPPEGCSYTFDHYVTNSEGDCCASMCYAVRSDGEARLFEITSSGQETSSGQAIIWWPSLANAIICSIIITKSMV